MPTPLYVRSARPCPCGADADSGCQLCRKCRGRARWARRQACPSRNARRRRAAARRRAHTKGGHRP